jgi:hypothetical protein
MPTRRSFGVLLVTLVVLCAGCSGSGRPATDEWLPEWAAAVSTVPDEVDLGDNPTRDTCNEILGSLREAQPTVEPTPYEVLDSPVRGWFEVAQAMFFECPPRQEGLDGFHEGYAQLSVLEAEVSAVLVAESGT